LREKKFKYKGSKVAKLVELIKKITRSKILYFLIWLTLLFWITIEFGYDHIYFIGYVIAATLITAIIYLFIKFISFLYKKFEKNKLAKSILTIILILLGIFIVNGASINKFRSGFYFEKYKTAEEAEAALLKLHPIGSSVDELVKTLERAGAEEYNPYSYYDNVSSDVKKYEKPNDMIFFRYENRTINSLYPKDWSISIKIDNNKIIKSLKIQIYQGE
jgi:hypothetical protein